MTPVRLREVLRAKPFRPFRLHLADGETVDVVHPELALLTQDSQTVVVVWPQNKLNIIDVPLVTRISRTRASPRRRGADT